MQIVNATYSLKYGLVTWKASAFAGVLNVFQRYICDEGPSMGKLLNKDLYRSVYNDYVRHTIGPILRNGPIPTSRPITNGLKKIHVISTNYSSTSTVPMP